MGQAISKRFMPKIAKATKSRDAQLMQDAFDDIARKKAFAKVKGATYYDPSAQDAGFKRDTWRDEELTPRDKEQQIFLKNMAAANNSVKNDDNDQISSQEMPEDLIKFLNDAGPLEKQVDESRTSPNVYESLKEEEEIRRQSEEAAKLRKRRRMPMVENIEGVDSENNTMRTDHANVEGNNDDEEDGLTTMKTTNFSTATLEDDDSDLKLSDDEIQQFLARLRKHQISVEDYLAERHHNDAKDAQSSIDETQKEKDLDLLKNTSKYVGVPVLMQDTDNSMVGAWEHRVEDLKLMRLTFPRNDAKLILGSSSDQNNDQSTS